MSETNMTNQDLENIRAVAPEWAEWLCVSKAGFGYWQSGQRGEIWTTLIGCLESNIVINLTTGSIHVQHAGKIVVVTLAEWSAEE